MGILTAQLINRTNQNILDSLKHVIGSSGFGHTYEYTAHINILNSIKEKTNKLTKPTKKLTDAGIQDIFNMEQKRN